MKFAAVFYSLVATGGLVATMPAKTDSADVAAESVNAAAFDGEKGIDAADEAQEAVELFEAGDIGAVTTGAAFATIDAQFQSISADVAASFAAEDATAAADAAGAADTAAAAAAAAEEDKGADVKAADSKAKDN